MTETTMLSETGRRLETLIPQKDQEDDSKKNPVYIICSSL